MLAVGPWPGQTLGADSIDISIEAESSNFTVEFNSNASSSHVSHMYAQDVLSLDFTVDLDNNQDFCLHLSDIQLINHKSDTLETIMLFLEGHYLSNITAKNITNTINSTYANNDLVHYSYKDNDLFSNVLCTYDDIILNGNRNILLYIENSDNYGVSIDYITLTLTIYYQLQY